MTSPICIISYNSIKLSDVAFTVFNSDMPVQVSSICGRELSSLSSGELKMKRSELGDQCREVSEVRGKVSIPMILYMDIVRWDTVLW